VELFGELGAYNGSDGKQKEMKLSTSAYGFVHWRATSIVNGWRWVAGNESPAAICTECKGWLQLSKQWNDGKVKVKRGNGKIEISEESGMSLEMKDRVKL